MFEQNRIRNGRKPTTTIRCFHKPAFSFVAIGIMTLFCSAAFGQSAQTPPPSLQEQVLANQVASLKGQIGKELNRLKQIENQLKESQDTHTELYDKRTQIFESQRKAGISSDSFPEIMKMLQSQRIELMIDLAGIDARRTAIQSGVESQSGTDDVSKLEVMELLNKLLDRREMEVKRLRSLASAGSGSQKELSAAHSAVLSTKLRIAEAKSDAKKSHLNSALQSRWSNQLLDLSLERAEKVARLKKTEELLSTIAPSRTLLLSDQAVASEIELNVKKLELLKTETVHTRRQIEDLKDALESVEQRVMTELDLP